MTAALRALVVGCAVGAAGGTGWAQAPKPKGVLVVPMGDAPVGAIDELCRRYTTRLHIAVDRSAPVALDQGLLDPVRDQAVAERALRWLETRFAREAADHVVVGVMSTDMYIASEQWRFAFSLRRRRAGAPGLAVISTARMDDAFHGQPPDPSRLTQRLGKMLTKNIGVLFYGLPLSDDPGSVMYRNVLGLVELDAMREHFDQPPTTRAVP